MKRNFLFLITILLFAAPAQAQFNGQTRGARPEGLGGAYVGAGQDAYAPIYNPAGLADLYHFETQASYAKPTLRAGQPWRDLGSFSAVYGSTSSFGGLGLWWSGDYIENVHRENTFALAYGKNVYTWREVLDFALGFNLKYLNNSLQTGAQDSRSDLSADLGFKATWNKRISLGAAVKDVNRPKVLDEPEGRLASTLDVGSGLWIDDNTLLALDVTGIRKDQQAKIRGGLERWLFNRTLALRAGGNSDFITGGLTLRTGKIFNWRGHLEYSYSHPLETDKNDKFHLLSLKLTFDEPGDVRRTQSASTETVAEIQEQVMSDHDTLAKKFGTVQTKHDYPLGTEDIVQIEVKNHPELNVTVIVDAWGQIKLPYVGNLEVRNMYPEGIEKHLEKIYADFFVEPPEVDVLVKEYHSRVVYVMGAVQAPGKYPIGGEPVTLRDIIIQAGLPTERAARWRVFIVRQTPEGPIYKHVNLYKILYRGELKNNLELESGDIVYLPMTLMDAFVTYLGRIFGPIVGFTAQLGSASTLPR